MRIPLALSFIALLCSSGIQVYAADSDKTGVNLDDTKISAPERKIDEVQTSQSNKFINEQAKALNSVPGVHLDPQDLKEEPVRKHISINPIRWLFGPVISLEENTKRMQQQMMKLTGPIASLQPAMLDLRKHMTNVGYQLQGMSGQMSDMNKELADMRERMDNIQTGINVTNTRMARTSSRLDTLGSQISNMQTSLSGTFAELKQMRPDITLVRRDISTIREPILKIEEPLVRMAQPLAKLTGNVGKIDQNIDAIRSPLVKIQGPISDLDNQLTGLHKEIESLRNMLGMILTAIFVCAALTVVGTPLAAILIWRNKHKLLPPPKPQEQSEDELTHPPGQQKAA